MSARLGSIRPGRYETRGFRLQAQVDATQDLPPEGGSHGSTRYVGRLPQTLSSDEHDDVARGERVRIGRAAGALYEIHRGAALHVLPDRFRDLALEAQRDLLRGLGVIDGDE